MKILHVLHHSLPELTGYAVRSHRLLRFQADAGWDTAAVTSARAGGPATSEWEEFDGITYYRTPAGGGLIADTRATVRRVGELTRELAPAIIHCHSPWLCALAGWVASSRARVPFVYEIRDFWEEAAVAIGKFGRRSPQYLAARTIDGFLLNRADHIITISEAQREHLLDRGVSAEKISVAGNGVDPDHFSPRPKPVELLRKYGVEHGPVVGYIGSLLPYEGLETLVRAFALVLESKPQARLMIVGDGDELAELKCLAQAAGVARAAVFTGRVPHGDILDYYAAMDVLVYPRLSNPTTRMTTPLKPLEAMAMAKPVIASDLPASWEIISAERTGLVCAAGDAQELARCCVRLLNDPRLAADLGAAARASMIETRRWDHTLATYTDVYAKLVGAAPTLAPTL